MIAYAFKRDYGVAISIFLVSCALPAYPNCDSEAVVKNGFIHNGQQKHLCKDCGRQFVKDALNKVISDETKALIGKLLLEKIPLAGIARVAEVSEPWLQGYVNEKYVSVPREVSVRAKERGRDKGNKQWIWLAIDAEARELSVFILVAVAEAGRRGLCLYARTLKSRPSIAIRCRC